MRSPLSQVWPRPMTFARQYLGRLERRPPPADVSPDRVIDLALRQSHAPRNDPRREPLTSQVVDMRVPLPGVQVDRCDDARLHLDSQERFNRPLNVFPIRSGGRRSHEAIDQELTSV